MVSVVKLTLTVNRIIAKNLFAFRAPMELLMEAKRILIVAEMLAGSITNVAVIKVAKSMRTVAKTFFALARNCIKSLPTSPRDGNLNCCSTHVN